MAGVEAETDAIIAPGGVEQRSELFERPAQRAARAGSVLEVKRAAIRMRERLADHLARAFDRLWDVALLRRTGVKDDAYRADPVAHPKRLDQGPKRLLANLRVLGGTVDQVHGV